MRSDHLSKHIKTHFNKKGVLPSNSGAAASDTPPAARSPEGEALSAGEQHSIVTMETLSPESLARLASSGINMVQVDLNHINGNY